MTAIVEGYLKQGIIELIDAPSELHDGHVRVIVLPQAEPRPDQLTFGKYQSDQKSTLEDFRDAEWRGDGELEDQNGQ